MLPGISQSTKDLIFRKIHKIQFLHILIFSSGASLYNLAATSLSCISNLAAVLMIPVTQGQRSDVPLHQEFVGGCGWREDEFQWMLVTGRASRLNLCTDYKLWNVLYLHSSSFTAICSPPSLVWERHGGIGMVLKRMYEEWESNGRLANPGLPGRMAVKPLCVCVCVCVCVCCHCQAINDTCCG